MRTHQILSSAVAFTFLLVGYVPVSASDHNGRFRLKDWAAECWRGERQKLKVFETCDARWIGNNQIGIILSRAPEGIGMTVSRSPCGRYYHPKKAGVIVQKANRAAKLNDEIHSFIAEAMNSSKCSKRLDITLTAESTEQFLVISDDLKVLSY